MENIPIGQPEENNEMVTPPPTVTTPLQVNLISSSYFDLPVQVTEIFRVPVQEEGGEDEVEIIDGDIRPKTKMRMEEYHCQLHILWEDIREIASYPYKDDWKIKGEKFHLLLDGKPSACLILGKMQSMLEQWRLYRSMRTKAQ